MWLVGRDGTSISLSPVGYEFPGATQNRWDRNWLVIAGKVDSSKGQWTFRDAALTTFEAKQIGPWLRRAGNGSIPISYLDPKGEVSPDLSFTEPNIAFSVAGSEEDAMRIRVHFSRGSAPPQLDVDDRFAHWQFFVELTMGEADLANAAAHWERELEDFPKDGTS